MKDPKASSPRLANHAMETLTRRHTGPARTTRLRALRRRPSEHHRGGERGAPSFSPLDAASTTTMTSLVKLLSYSYLHAPSEAKGLPRPPAARAVDGGEESPVARRPSMGENLSPPSSRERRLSSPQLFGRLRHYCLS
jgi:hypothetical protein